MHFVFWDFLNAICIHRIVSLQSADVHDYTPCPEKRCHFISGYNSRISWSIFIVFFSPVRTGMNTAQFPVIYLLNSLMTSLM